MIILPVLTTSLIHFFLKGWEKVLFELGSERVNLYNSLQVCEGGPMCRVLSTKYTKNECRLEQFPSEFLVTIYPMKAASHSTVYGKPSLRPFQP